MNKNRMTNAERRMYFRHKRKLYRIEQRAAKRKNKVSGQFMNRVVICMILAAFIYTVVAIIVFVRVGAEPSTLTENVFRFLSVEGGAMALIQRKIQENSTRTNRMTSMQTIMRRCRDEIHR